MKRILALLLVAVFMAQSIQAQAAPTVASVQREIDRLRTLAAEKYEAANEATLKIKALQKEIKLLEKAKAKLEKSMKGKKKEVLDETENVDEASPEYMAAKQEASDEYDNTGSIESTQNKYPEFADMLEQDIIGAEEGQDY